ncbi:MAG: FHA domain-containing protein [Archangium sp.]|nr:FHA domain-containing protein [Archangium sp.]
MLSVRELAQLARTLDVEGFSAQIGPFALMQRPPHEVRVKSSRGVVHTSARPMLVMRPPPASIDFGDLQVALLPPPSADGSSELIIGRAPDCDVVVEDATVSKRHARIRWDGGHGVLRELGSTNGTFVEGRRIKSSWTLEDGNALGFGEAHFLYLLAPTLYRRMRQV